jgi:glycosyltransferase involved in cell wall biosynthesis
MIRGPSPSLPLTVPLQFHVISFEGPDSYSRAGGIASRVAGLTQALAQAGFDTHLWFIGDPDLPGAEKRGALTLHRWCQWISRYHPGGVYDGEEGKRNDLVASLPPYLMQHHLMPTLRGGSQYAVVMAEEWQTVEVVYHLDALLREAGIRPRVAILWNANNTFGFDHIDWPRLARAATITTVSRYMRHQMWELGVDPLVIPNGIGSDRLRPPDHAATKAFRRSVQGRLVLSKVARWDPDKRWLLAVDTVALLKRLGWRPLLIARGGVEAHGAEVLARAKAAGLRTVDRVLARSDGTGLVESLQHLYGVDVVNLRSPLTAETARVLFRGSAAVLANSGREPFGLVGLETMAAGGVACVGGTGEDYAVPGWNALLLQTQDPREFVSLFRRVLENPGENHDLRSRALATARRYAWLEVTRRDLLPRVAPIAQEGTSAAPRTAVARGG